MCVFVLCPPLLRSSQPQLSIADFHFPSPIHTTPSVSIMPLLLSPLLRSSIRLFLTLFTSFYALIFAISLHFCGFLMSLFFSRVCDELCVIRQYKYNTMPLYKKKPFPMVDNPTDLSPDEAVFQVRFTKEIFRDYR